MDRTKIILLLSITLLFLILLEVGRYYYRTTQVKRTDNLVSNEPTHTEVAGFIKKIGTRTITVERNNSEFTLSIAKNTKLTEQSFTIPYLNKPLSSQNGKELDISELQDGQWVLINFMKDRFSKNHVVAATLTLNVPHAIRGTLLHIESDRLRVKGYPLSSSAEEMIVLSRQEKEYQVIVDGETEISFMPPPLPGVTPTVQNMSVSELKPGDQITVYSGSVVSKDNPIHALRIEPISALSASLLSPVSSTPTITPQRLPSRP